MSHTAPVHRPKHSDGSRRSQRSSLANGVCPVEMLSHCTDLTTLDMAQTDPLLTQAQPQQPFTITLQTCRAVDANRAGPDAIRQRGFDIGCLTCLRIRGPQQRAPTMDKKLPFCIGTAGRPSGHDFDRSVAGLFSRRSRVEHLLILVAPHDQNILWLLVPGRLYPSQAR